MKARLIKASTLEGLEQIQIYKHTKQGYVAAESAERPRKPRVVTVTTKDVVYKNYKPVYVTKVEKIEILPSAFEDAKPRRPSRKTNHKPNSSAWKKSIDKLDNPRCHYSPRSDRSLNREPGKSEPQNYPPLTRLFEKR